ncbi:hypothetical protein ACT6QH_04750 [Xanthobacter sp. TB0139]|uniref:hypothetical protein n=1 Tax=Xanthobacter sp. TB0139 TaxID=3459178 RepID=UPI004039868B
MRLSRIFTRVLAAAMGVMLAVGAPSAGVAGQKDPVVGKWDVTPMIGPNARGCTVTFRPAGMNGKGRVEPFACHRLEGLGGLHGFADVRSWRREGDSIVLSGIAQPQMGRIHLPADTHLSRLRGMVKGDILFTMIRK